MILLTKPQAESGAPTGAVRGPVETRRPSRGAFYGFVPCPSTGGRPAFTLIELILVMAILTMAAALTAPVLSNFFRGRSLDSEARRLLALTHRGQSRAVSEGVPIDLWVNPEAGNFGLEAEPSYETSDSRAVEFKLDSGLQMEVVNAAAGSPTALTLTRLQSASTASAPKVTLTHPGLPTIRFLPDGTLSESSPQRLRLSARDGSALWLAQATDKLSYEIRKTDK